ncbi:hypothetical protein WHI96_24345 [Pseudonocardia tropica]|uniref:Uncharacterized protein n=1 Tax=Pseudonocardia tropica TaxID=681289 RepID=A0ABV1K156_9PSEU
MSGNAFPSEPSAMATTAEQTPQDVDRTSTVGGQALHGAPALVIRDEW